MDIRAEKVREFEQAAHMLLPGSEIGTSVFRSMQNEPESRFRPYIYQRSWQQRAELDSYCSTDNFRSWIGAMKVLGEIRDVTVFSHENVENFPL